MLVMPGLVPGIHVLSGGAWMAGTDPAVTPERYQCLKLREAAVRSR
jgi:hypothetical protein